MHKKNTADFSGIIDVVILWSNIVLAVLMGLAVIVFAIWKLIIILISIMRNADNPEATGNDLSALKWPIIAIIIILVVVAVMNVLLQVIKSYNLSIGT